ncbi:hypothetical protein ACFL5I_01740 [Planctomycetota bacterium]
MRQLILGVVLLGMIGSIVAVFLAFSSRNEAVGIQLDAEEKRDESIVKRDEAFRVRDEALKLKQEAENNAQVAETKYQKAEESREKAVRQIEIAYKAQNNASTAKQKADDERDQALLAAKAAKESQERAELIQAKAEAEKEVALADRNNIQTQLNEATTAKQATEDEYRKLKEVTAEAEEISRFTSKLIADTFIPLDNGDKHYMDGCDMYARARTAKEKYTALKSLEKAKQYYEISLESLKKTESVNELTAEVIDIISQAMGENISSVEIVRDTLTKMLKTPPPSTEEIDDKGKQAINRKHSADNTIVTACARILDLMEDYHESFTKTQRASVENLKKKLADRIGPSSKESSSSSTQ